MNATTIFPSVLVRLPVLFWSYLLPCCFIDGDVRSQIQPFLVWTDPLGTLILLIRQDMKKNLSELLPNFGSAF